MGSRHSQRRGCCGAVLTGLFAIPSSSIVSGDLPTGPACCGAPPRAPFSPVSRHWSYLVRARPNRLEVCRLPAISVLVGRSVAVGQVISLAMVSSCGDACRQGARGCSHSFSCGVSLIVRRRLGAASGEHLRMHDGTLASDSLAILSLFMACTSGGLW